MIGGKALKRIGYVVFAIVALLFSFYQTFPAEAVGQRLAHEWNARAGGVLTVSFGEVSPYRFSGIAAEGVKLKTNPSDGSEPSTLELDEMRLRLQLLPLIVFSPTLSGEVVLGEGSISATVSKDGDDLEVSLEFDEVDFASSSRLAKVTGLSVGGQLEGTLEGRVGMLPEWKGLAPERSEASGTLTVTRASIGPGKVKDFTIPAAIALGDLDLSLEMKRGRARVSSFSQKGGQLDLDLFGSTSLRRQLTASSFDSCIKLKFNDQAFLEKHGKLKAALQLAEVALKKDADGFLHIKHTGTVGKPRSQRGLCRGDRGVETPDARKPPRRRRE